MPDPTSAQRSLALDLAVAAGLLVLAGLVVLSRVNLTTVPQEDAAMLLRYSEHVAQGYGIVWNLDGPPVDGATDFLFMLLVAGVRRAGVGLETSCHGVGLVAHLLTVAVVYTAIRAWGPRSRTFAALASAYVAVGPGFGYIAAGFGATFFGLCAAVTAATFLASLHHRDRHLLVRLFGLSGLVLGLARPEGVFLAVLFAAVRVGLAESDRRLQIASELLLILFGLGSIYFIWHWVHFRHPFPNPFYVRASNGGHFTSLKDAIKSAARLLVPLAPVWIAAWAWGDRRRALWFASPLVGFVLLWSVLTHTMNFLFRYQYPLLPVTCILAGELLRDLKIPGLKLRASLVAASLALAVWALPALHPPPGTSANGPHELALVLARFHGHTMVTTEAGILPLYSGWRAIDAWGLNDPVVAHGGLSDCYLDQNHPALFVIHAPLDPARSLGGGWGRWDQMTSSLRRYAADRGYVLAAAFGDAPSFVLLFYVNPQIRDARAIVEAIRQVGFATNFAPAPAMVE